MSSYFKFFINRNLDISIKTNMLYIINSVPIFILWIHLCFFFKHNNVNSVLFAFSFFFHWKVGDDFLVFYSSIPIRCLNFNFQLLISAFTFPLLFISLVPTPKINFSSNSFLSFRYLSKTLASTNLSCILGGLIIIWMFLLILKIKLCFDQIWLKCVWLFFSSLLQFNTELFLHESHGFELSKSW